MANEIALNASLTFKKNGVEESLSKTSSITVSGKRCIRHVQNIGTSEEAMVIGELATLGYCMIRNMDSTNYVEIRSGTGTANFMKLKAGESAGPFRFGSGATAPYAIANTAAVDIEYLIIED